MARGRVAVWRLVSKNDWKNYFALNLSNLAEPYAIPAGPSEGCGQPPNPPVVDHEGDLISWWPTRFCKLTLREGTFGTRYFIDLAAINPVTGRRRPFDAGPPVNVWPMETDNLYALSTGGRFCYWRQRFRGTYAMDLAERRHHAIQVEVRTRDGGTWNAPVMYVDNDAVRLPALLEWQPRAVSALRWPTGGSTSRRITALPPSNTPTQRLNRDRESTRFPHLACLR
jgi:hypothetical protein